MMGTKQFIMTACHSFLVLLLVACGNDNAGPSDSSEKQSAQSKKDNPTALSIAEAISALSNESIDFKAITGQLPETVTEPGPCPFLSDETAIASASSGFKMTRRSVANDRCIWSYNAGFSIKVTVDPLKPTEDAGTPNYNMGVDAVLKAQTGPGAKANILYDTTWGNERPYAFVFEQNNKAIQINITGMKTDETKLRVTANEIAQNLPSATKIEPQYRLSEPAFDICTTWDKDKLPAVLGLSEFQVASSTSSCVYKIYPSKKSGRYQAYELGINVFKTDFDSLDYYRKKGAEDLLGFTIPTVLRTMGDPPDNTAVTTLSEGYIVDVWMAADVPYGREANIALARNLFERLGL